MTPGDGGAALAEAERPAATEATLGTWLASRPSAVDREELAVRLNLIARVADAVQRAHRRGQVGLVLQTATVVLVDPSVEPPEIATPVTRRLRDSGPDAVEDVRALAMVACQILTGVNSPERVKPLRQVWPGPARLDDDLECIINTAAAPEASGRYATAAALADDIRRYLASEPVSVRTPAFGYQLRKLAGRWKGVSALAVLVFVLVVAGAVTMTMWYMQSQQQLQRATEAERDARQNALVAQGALDRYLTRVGESRELQARGLEDLRRQLLDAAREFYLRQTTGASDATPSHATAMERGRAWSRVAAISRTMSDFRKAEDAGVQAVAIFDRARRARPDDPDVAGALAGALGDLARLRSDAGQDGPAEAHFRRAQVLNAEAVQRQPGRADWRVQQAGTFDDYGRLLERAKRVADAERLYRQAQSVREALVAESATNVEYRHALMLSDSHLGQLIGRTDRAADAEAALRKATEIGEKLVADAPAEPDYQEDLADAWHALGTLLVSQTRAEDATLTGHKEAAVRERLAADHPAVLDYRLQLGAACTALGNVEAGQQHWAAALPWQEKAIEALQWVVTREPVHPAARYSLSRAWSGKARALDGLGRWRESAVAWQTAVDFDDRNDQELQAGLSKARRRSGR